MVAVAAAMQKPLVLAHGVAVQPAAVADGLVAVPNFAAPLAPARAGTWRS